MEITICESKILQVSKAAEVREILAKNHILYLTEFQKLTLVEKKRCRSDKISPTHPESELKASWRRLDKEKLATGHWRRD